MSMTDCPVCLIPCDPRIHAATLRLREWRKKYIEEMLRPVDLSNKMPTKKTANVPVVYPSKVGRPRVENSKHVPTKVPGAGQGKGNRIERVTAEKVRSMRSMGMTVKEVAKALACSRDTVMLRMREERLRCGDVLTVEVAG